MSFDLHTHSTCSDGTESPADVVRSAAALRDDGLLGIALTDHDTADGWAAAAQAAGEHGVTLVRGTEVSCEFHRLSVHLLSYLHQPDHPGLRAELDRARDSRLHRAERMVGSLAEEYPITWADVLAQVSPGATVGRPHIADALVAAGVVKHRDDAFADILSARSRHYVPYYAPHPEQAIRLVREAGGVPVLAHGLAPHRGRVLSVPQIEGLIAAGLAGIEVYHREHSPADARTLLDLSRRHHLIVTGSSDYHGTGKQNRLGENRTDRANLERIEAAGTLEVLWATG